MTDHTPQNARHHSGKVDLRSVDHGLDVGDCVRIVLIDTGFERGVVDFARA